MSLQPLLVHFSIAYKLPPGKTQQFHLQVSALAEVAVPLPRSICKPLAEHFRWQQLELLTISGQLPPLGPRKARSVDETELARLRAGRHWPLPLLQPGAICSCCSQVFLARDFGTLSVVCAFVTVCGSELLRPMLCAL